MSDDAVRCPKLPWMIDFHSTAEGTIPNSQLKAAFADYRIQHLSDLDSKSQVPLRRLTSIMCTLGPSCNSQEILEKLMGAGMTVARLKMSYYDDESLREIIQTIRRANDNYSKSIGRIYPLPIAIDLKGAEIRTGTFKDVNSKEIELAEGNTIYLTTDPSYEEHVTEDMIFVDYEKMNEVIEPGDTIYLNDGSVTLSAIQIVGSIIRCIVESAGKILNLSRISIPGVPVDLPVLSEKDHEDIKLAIQQDIDMIIVPCVKTPGAIKEVREALGEEGQHIKVIAKIENSQGLDRFDDILEIADAIMVSRNNLTLELQQEKIFLIQKSIIAKCNQAGKPVVLGSLMLESMINSLKPTRAEISDVANSIIDGADCLVLSKETAIGLHPVESVQNLSVISKEAEAAVHQRQLFRELSEKVLSPIEPPYAIAISAVEASIKCNAAAIILCTTTGRSAELIAQFRPRCPIIALTRLAHVARKMHLFRAIDPIYYIKPLKGNWYKDVENRIQLGITYGKVTGFIRQGDALVIVTGARQGSGFTNAMKIVYASAFDALPSENTEIRKSSIVKQFKQIKPKGKKKL